MSTKADVLNRLDATYAELRATIDRMTEPQRNERWLGSWGLRELLAHLSGWHREMTAGLQRLARGERPTPEGVDYSDADGWNAKFAEGAAPTPGEAIARFEETHRGFREALAAVPDDRFGEGKTVNRIAGSTGSDHYQEHLEQMRDWLEGRGAG